MTRVTTALCLLLAAPLWAATTLLDFESETERALFHDEGASTAANFPVTREARWASSGQYSLCFRTPQYRPGRGEWPAIELQPPLADWSASDRLVFDVVNPGAADQKLLVFLSDSKRATRDGYLVRADLVPSSYTQVVVELAKVAAAGVNLKDLHVMHFFTERPPADLEVYVDRLVLLRSGEPLPVPQPAFVRQMAATQQAQLQALQQFQQQAAARLRQLTAGAPTVRAWAEQLLADNERRIAAFAAQVAQGDPAALQSAALVASLRTATARLERVVALRVSFESFRKQVSVRERPDLVVGFASPMEKVLPRAGVPSLRISPRASLALARNEREALQVVVMPTERAAKQVSVQVGDLRSASGAVLSAAQIDTPPLGYVETKNTPPYGSSHVGWWPDPILDFLRTVDVAAGDAQSFWVRVRAPERQAPGTYRGKLQVLAGGRAVYAFDLSVEVYPFTLPGRSPLNMAVTFAPMYYEPNGQGGWQEGPYRDKCWQQHKLQWGDFLADYYLTYDSLYHHTDPEWAVLTRLHEQGRLGMFNLGYYGAMPDKPEEQEKWQQDVRGHIGKAYAQAKALGLLDHAYIYGCDENPEAMFPAVERAAAFLKREYPGALVLTTTYDHSFGTSSVLQSMDGFCPLTPSYKRELADRVRATGKQVWWYICCGPGHPFANMFVEFPAIEGRLLMGAQTVKERPDGFLYYEISIWNAKPITRGPFTDWDPRSWTTFNGDGSWTCMGPGGTPLPTIRLENFRDGVEDYAYAVLLEQQIKATAARASLTATEQHWLQRARAALEVPVSVSRSMTEYTHDPADVYRWRRGMAEALRTAPGAPR